MNNYGFVKVAAAVPHVRVADCPYNAQHIGGMIHTAYEQGVQIVVFPEMAITGYTCGDLFLQQLLQDQAQTALERVISDTAQLDVISVIGIPIAQNSILYNAAAVIQKGQILGVAVKTYLPNYREFYEKRWFAPATRLMAHEVTLCGRKVKAGNNLLFKTPDTVFGVEICEDLWAPIPPSSYMALQGAEIILNLSADNESIGKHDYLRSLIGQQSARCLAGYVFSSCGYGESTTDVVFAGNGIIYENGKQLAHSKRFCMDEQLTVSEIDVDRLRSERRVNTTFAANAANTVVAEPVLIQTMGTVNKPCVLTREVNPFPFVPQGKELTERCEEIFSIQISGLAQRLRHTKAKSAVIGISGGLDSTLALLVSAQTFDKLSLPRKGIIGVTMPGFGTTDRTYRNAMTLMRCLGVTIREIPIKAACIQHFKDIGHDIDTHDVTYENCQARERTQILMDIANQTGGLVIGTGDLSELALGWATYNGDHMSMYGVNVSVPKTLVKYLVEWVARNRMDQAAREVLLDVAGTPISPELIPADKNGLISQKTEDIVGPYELHDFFLYYFIRFGFSPSKILYLATRAFKGRYGADTVTKWLGVFIQRFFQQQFKRSCLPDGPKVGSIAVSPRGDWRMPSDACATLWVNDIHPTP